jgi:SOS-response transcriptional repressor LexA
MPTGLTTTRRGEYCILQAAVPERGVVPLGVYLLDLETRQGYVRVRPDCCQLDDDEADVFELLEEDLRAKAREMGGEAVLLWLEDHASNAIQLTGRQSVLVDDPERTVDRLLKQVLTPRARLPVYSLKAAATRFGEHADVSEDRTVEAPEHLRVTEGMFVIQVVGRSMEPRIPDGSYCVFRAPVTGTRQGRILLIELFSEADFGARYTVKKYTSVKRRAGEDEWAHETIRLEPLNREFSAFELRPDECQVIAEFVQVLSPG